MDQSFLVMVVLNKPARTIEAHQVSNVYGIANTGNRVFNDQMVTRGPRITRAITNATTRNTFITAPIKKRGHSRGPQNGTQY
jgi:hypothetical protein